MVSSECNARSYSYGACEVRCSEDLPLSEVMLVINLLLQTIKRQESVLCQTPTEKQFSIYVPELLWAVLHIALVCLIRAKIEVHPRTRYPLRNQAIP